MGTPVNIIVGSHVWAEDPEVAWIDGEVAEIKGGNATIITANGKTIVASLGSIYPNDTEAPPAGVDDMTKLAYLHEPGVLQNLSCRYSLNEIYMLVTGREFRAMINDHGSQSILVSGESGAPRTLTSLPGV